MRQRILKQMKRWLNSLSQWGKLDSLYMESDYNALGKFIKQETSKSLVRIAKNCRDYSLNPNFQPVTLVSIVSTFISNLEEAMPTMEMDPINRNLYGESIGQSVRYRDTTRKLYSERLRFAGDVSLRSMDVNIADGQTSRKVRRIVEKRMCQAYYRQSKILARRDNNHSRQDMRRAVSYQLQNLGQSEIHDRGMGTHWKQGRDVVTGAMVMKQKHSYNSLEEASEKARLYMDRHPEENVPMVAYRCAHCGKYHIGHDYVVVRTLETA